MWLNLGQTGYSTGQALGFDMGVAPLPQGNTINSAGLIGVSDALFISAQSQDPAACWSWLKYMSNSIGDMKPKLQGHNLFPARTTIAQSAAFVQQAPLGAQETYNTYIDLLIQGLTNVTIETEDVYINNDYWLMQAVDKIMQGGNVEEELDRAQAIAERFLRCYQDENSDSRACAQQADPSYKE